jgi:hypothetical protein
MDYHIYVCRLCVFGGTPKQLVTHYENAHGYSHQMATYAVNAIVGYTDSPPTISPPDATNVPDSNPISDIFELPSSPDMTSTLRWITVGLVSVLILTIFLRYN